MPPFEITRTHKKKGMSINYFTVRNLFTQAEKSSLEGVGASFKEIISDLIRDINDLELEMSLNAYFIRKLSSTRQAINEFENQYEKFKLIFSNKYRSQIFNNTNDYLL